MSGSSGLEIDRGNPALPVLPALEAHRLALAEAAEFRALDRRDVDEHVFRAVLGLNEAETLRGIEPFDCTDGHLSLRACVAVGAGMRHGSRSRNLGWDRV